MRIHCIQSTSATKIIHIMIHLVLYVHIWYEYMILYVLVDIIHGIHMYMCTVYNNNYYYYHY